MFYDNRRPRFHYILNTKQERMWIHPFGLIYVYDTSILFVLYCTLFAFNTNRLVTIVIYLVLGFNFSPPGQNCRHFAGDISDACSWMKIFVFLSKFHWILSLTSNWEYVSIGLNNGLAPNRRQAIICINAHPIRWRKFVALGEMSFKHNRN